MEIEELTIEQQIEVLKEAKGHYILNYKPNYDSNNRYVTLYSNTGMCLSIRIALSSFFDINVGSGEISKLIPTFTLNHLIKAYDNNEIKMIRPTDTLYWWDKNDKDSRKAAFDFLIKELESKL